MADTGYRQMVNEAKRPIRLAKRDDTPLAAAGFVWNDSVMASRWEITINGKCWHLYWELGGLVAKRILSTASGTSILTMATFDRPITVCDALAIKQKLAQLSGGAS